MLMLDMRSADIDLPCARLVCPQMLNDRAMCMRCYLVGAPWLRDGYGAPWVWLSDSHAETDREGASARDAGRRDVRWDVQGNSIDSAKG